MKEYVEKILEQAGVPEQARVHVEIPINPELGDYAFPCFSLAPLWKKNPVQIAQELQRKIQPTKEISAIQATGPYLNFFINHVLQTKTVLTAILKQKETYGSGKSAHGKNIVIECSSPNIAKPFGIGHLRSTIIGSSLASIARSQGAHVTTLNYLGDWGTQFGKLIVGYERFGNAKKLKQDATKHLLELYIKVNADPTLEQPARDAFKKLEEGNTKYLALWKQFKEASLKEFEEVYQQLGVSCDVLSGESFYNKKKEAVLDMLKKKKLLKTDEGAEIVDLQAYGLGVCLIQKSDGTTLYATRDIAAALDRQKKYKADELWYEVGGEQRLHFQQVFKLLALLGNSWAKNCYHIDHGLYLDQDGKKFATRKGKTVFMKDILTETIELAEKEILKRTKLTKKELQKRSRAIARAAIIYGDLKNYRGQDSIFDIDTFIRFEGDTGPYILYSYARAQSIIRKSKGKHTMILPKQLTKTEKKLSTLLTQFPIIVQKAYEQKAPHHIAVYAFQLAQAFNEFYHAEHVIESEQEAFRIALVQAYAQTLKNALTLLHIPVIDAM